MPERFPATRPSLRSFASQQLVLLGLHIITTAVKLLPPDHPQRVFTTGCVELHRDSLRAAARPKLPWRREAGLSL